MLISGDTHGCMNLWDLDERSLIGKLEIAHQRGITGMYFYDKEPILLTSGEDNAIKLWIFDQDDEKPRLLKSRSGHMLPPSKIDFYVSSSMIISGGKDRALRIFSTVRDQRNKEFSQGKIQSKANKLGIREENLKLNPIVDFDASIKYF